MRHTNHKKLKSIVAGSLSVAMLSPLVNSLPVEALKTDVKIYSYDDFEIQYEVTGEWKNHQNIMVTVINKSDEPIYNWAFKYNANGKISEIWGAEALECIDNEYVIGSVNYDSKIKNSVSFGYILECDDEKVDVPEDFTLCTKRVDIETGYDIDTNVTFEWADSYIGEISITNTSEEPIVGWKLSLDSLNKITTVWNGDIQDSTGNSYVIAPGEYGYYIDPGTTVKVGFIADKTDNAKLDVEIKGLSAVVRDWTFDTTPDFTDTTDTDSDKLPDVYEKHVYGTDPKKADTDGDGLPDGYEIITLKTNPREADSNNNKVTDDKEDFDSDKLTNIEEYELGTNPFAADTDDDGLSDYDEVKEYGTDPLKVDTDEDTVWDGDEIKLGLDPTDSSDGDTPVKQAVAEEDLEINEYNDDFKISLDITASNYVPDYLEQEESPYTGILSDNRSIIGTPINIEYTGGTITDGSIIFRMSEETINSASHFFEDYDKGLERYGIFIYDEEIGTIIPVPAIYDEENLTISIDASTYMGNLMIIDYESLMYDLGIDPTKEDEEITPPEEEIEPETDDSDITTEEIVIEEDTAETTEEAATDESVTDDEATATEETVSDETAETEETLELLSFEAAEDLSLETSLLSSTLMASPVALGGTETTTTTSSSAWRQVDLVIVIDTTGSMGSSIDKVRRNLTNLIDKLRDDNISLYVSLIDFKDITCGEKTIMNNNNGKQFYSSPQDVKAAISGMRASGGGDTPETDIDGLGMANSLNYRSSSSKYLFLITDTYYKNDNNFGIETLQEVADKLHNKDVMTNIIVPTSYYSTYAPLVSDPDKSKININTDFCDAMYEIISNGSVDTDTVILGSNLVTGSFKSALTYGGPENSDTDGLTDSEEVNWDYVKDLNTKTGEFELPTWEELCKMSKLFKTNPYKGGTNNVQFSKFKSIKVVPATSNPFLRDSDGDYYPDDKEKLEDRLTRNNMYINDAALDDSNYNKGEIFTEADSPKYTDGSFCFSTCDGPAKTQQRSWYSFTRKSNSTYYFDLTPVSDSYYKFGSEDTTSSTIKVTYKSWGKTKTVSPDSDGIYLLEDGTDYTIKFTSTGSYENCRFTVSQDNWVYAPNGGKWEVTKYALGNVVSNVLNDKTIYMPSSRIVSSIAELTGGTSVVCDPDGDMEAQIRQILSNNGMKVDEGELEGALRTIGGAAGTTILFFLPIPGGKVSGGLKAVKLIVSTFTNYCTYSGVPDAISTLLKYMEQYGFKEAYEKGHTNVYTCHNVGIGRNWNAWETAPYIRKITYGNIGTVNINVSDAEIIEFCDWEVSDPA